jgi:SAM-dependent methyltransferase
MNTYEGLHARHYDLIYADKPYEREAGFVAGQLGTRKGALLDLACGTGRHALAFAEMGFEVTGVDYGEELLERARRNAADAGSDIEFVLGDMRTVELERRFDAVTCLFDSIGYPLTDEGVVSALATARSHLKPGGAVAIEFLHAPAALAASSPVRVRRWATPDGGRLLRISETTIDPAASKMSVAYELIELQPDGAGYEAGANVQENRFFSAPEMDELLRRAGLEPERFVAAYEEDPEVSEQTWHVLALARPADR